MDDPVDRLIVERQGMEAGFPRSVVLSIVAHVLIASAAIAAPFVFPRGPLLQVAPGFAVVLPRGGGGAPAAAAPPARTPDAAPTAAPAEPPPPDRTKVAQPPKEEPRTGLPELDAKPHRHKPEAPVPSRGAATAGKEATGSARGGTGTSSLTPGIAFGPPGVGVPEGTDTGGDWYMAGVQQKIWMLWTQDIRAGFNQPIGVSFTILADGTLTDVRLTQSCGAPMLDLAAQRAVTSAGPFGPLPKDYGTDRKTIQAVFKPTS